MAIKSSLVSLLFLAIAVAGAIGCGASGSPATAGGGAGGSGQAGTAGSAGVVGSAGAGGLAVGGQSGTAAAGTGGQGDAAGGGAAPAGAGGDAAGGGTAPDAGAPAGDVILANVGAADIALGGGFVYFANDTAIGRVPIGGGAVESVYTKFTTSGPRFIDADDTRIVWTEHAANTVFGAVRSCPISGCGTAPTDFPKKGESTNAISLDGDLVVWSSATLRSVLSTGVFGIGSPGLSLTDVVTEGGDVFWLDGGLLTTVGAVYKAPATASATAAKLSDAVGNPTKLSVHGDHVVVLSDIGVFQMGRDGSALTRLADGSPAYEVDVVTDGTRVYWAIGKNLYGCQLGSCTPTLVDTSTGLSAGLEIDSTHLYWGTQTSIRRLDL